MLQGGAGADHGREFNPVVDALLDEYPGLACLLSADFKVLRINRLAAAVLGHPPQAIKGAEFGAFFDGDSKARLKSTAEAISSEGDAVKLSLMLKDSESRESRISAVVRNVKRVPGGEKLFLFVARDPASRDADAREPIAVDALLARMLQGSSDAIILLDGYSRTIYEYNKGAEALFGWTRDEAVGKTPLFLASSDVYASDYLDKALTSFATAGFFQDKVHCQRKDGSEFLALVSAFAFFDRRGGVGTILVILRDLSDDERRLDDIHRLSEQCVRVAKALAESVIPLVSGKPSQSLSGLGFTRRQVEIAAIVMKGEPTKAVAHAIGYSESSIKSQLSAMYHKVGARSRVEFVKYLIDHGIRIE